jgi:predicted nucleic acid-binding protein
MRLLIDANCLLEVVRRRPSAADVERLLLTIPHGRMKISDFAVHSIALVMERFAIVSSFPRLIDGAGIGKTIAIARLYPTDWPRVIEVMTAHRLDVDDAYQYVAAELDHRRIVSLDADFDRTPNGRLTPAQALQLFKDETT